MQNNYPFQNETVVRVGGREHKNWQSYQIDSDFLIPADAFDFDTGMAAGGDIPDLCGEACEVMINGQTVLTGIIGGQRHEKAKGSRSFRFSGRDLAGFLVDCSAPQLNTQGMTLLAAAQKLAAPWPQIKKLVLKAEHNPVLAKIDIEPGETVWQALLKAANSVGLHAWMEPDGTLAVGGADYSTPPVATLCWSRNDGRRNIARIRYERDDDNRYSEVTFLAQSHAKRGDTGKHDLKWRWRDPNVKLHKPKTVVIGDAENLASLKKHARKQLSDWRLEGFTATVTVADHKTRDGTLWQPGQRVHLVDEEEGIDAVFFVMGRRFALSRLNGTQTELTLKEDGVWTPDAYEQKAAAARKRRGKGKGPSKKSGRTGGKKAPRELVSL